jgi:sterol 3beta-glucosyltransferase
MRIGMQTCGTDGDILPFISLARGLSNVGYTITLVITSWDGKEYSCFMDRTRFKIIQTISPIKYNPVLLDFTGATVVTKPELYRQLEIFLDTMSSLSLTDACKASVDLCCHNDLILAHPLSYQIPLIASRTGIPYMNVALTAYPLPSDKSGKEHELFFWGLPPGVVKRKYKEAVIELCRPEGLGRVDNEVMSSNNCSLNLIAASRVFYQQTDGQAEDHICGFFDVPDTGAKWEIKPELESFLNRGRPPVYITFGSMAPRNIVQRIHMIRRLKKAVKLANCRAIIQVACEDLRNLRSDDQVLFNPPSPYKDVFPRCSAVVHHGASGTTHMATRAGCPSIVLAHIMSQVFWGHTLERLGVGPPLLHILDWTESELAQKMIAVENSSGMKQKAQKLGRIIRSEDGVGEVVKSIERWHDFRTV